MNKSDFSQLRSNHEYVYKSHHRNIKIQLKYSVFLLKEIQTSRKGKLEHLFSLCRENQLIYQIPTWVSHESIHRSELCLNLLGDPVKKYIPFMSQHENCSFNSCYCLAEHKTLKKKKETKKNSTGQGSKQLHLSWASFERGQNQMTSRSPV